MKKLVNDIYEVVKNGNITVNWYDEYPRAIRKAETLAKQGYYTEIWQHKTLQKKDGILQMVKLKKPRLIAFWN